MKRRQLFEFTDLAGTPKLLRRLVTEFLAAITEIFRPFDARMDLLLEALVATGDERIVDLCSGGPGPWRRLGPSLRSAAGRRVSVVLTDKFPQTDSVGSDASITYWPEPVDACRVPGELAGLRTVFNGFHHFGPDRAEGILRDATRSRRAIAIYEALRRDGLGLCVPFFSPVAVLLLSPFVRPFRWSRLLFTYAIPVAPLLITWDAVVSALRCYKPDELLAMARRAGGDDYAWSAGRYWSNGVPVTYLVGYPTGEGARAIEPAASREP